MTRFINILKKLNKRSKHRLDSSFLVCSITPLCILKTIPNNRHLAAAISTARDPVLSHLFSFGPDPSQHSQAKTWGRTGTQENMEDQDPSAVEQPKAVIRKEKRKALKKEKRKQIRKEIAEKARTEEEARLNDPEEQRKIQLEEEREKERVERERKEFEERERIFLEELERKKEEEEEQERINAAEREIKSNQEGAEEGLNDDDEWEYVEEGPPEIIWQGNEIIVKKNKVKVKKKDTNQDIEKEDSNRPTSNPLPPQSEAYASYKNDPMTSAELLDTVAQQVPNFGTEQDKAHCPFHIKTGACRFGIRCNRVHYYPDKSDTLLIKNMYNGPGLAWEQDEGLEHTEEEVERSYEEFYEDVHTEFQKFGEIINFKVCRNGSFHLRGNVYVHYKSMDSAVMAYNSVQGRYFAGKQVQCEFVCLSRWKVAICGEYMKSRLKTCSRGSACNFLHCFSNPGGDYEWADSDKPPPRFWIKKMTALFGYSDDSWHDRQLDQPSPKDQHHFTSERDRHRSVETHKHNGSSRRSHHEKNHATKSRDREQQKDNKYYDDETRYKNNHRFNSIAEETDSDGDRLDKNTQRHRDRSESRSRHNRRESTPRDYNSRSRTPRGKSSDEDLYTDKRVRRSQHSKEVPESSNDDEKSDDAKHDPRKVDSQNYKKQRASSNRYNRRSSRHNSDEGGDEVDDQESEDERFAKKQKSHKRNSATDRSRSHDSAYFTDTNDTSDRWEPDSSPNEHDNVSNKVGVKDNQMSEIRKSKDRRSSRETGLGGGSVEEDSKISEGFSKSSHRENTHSHDHDEKARAKRKRI